MELKAAPVVEVFALPKKMSSDFFFAKSNLSFEGKNELNTA